MLSGLVVHLLSQCSGEKDGIPSASWLAKLAYTEISVK